MVIKDEFKVNASVQNVYMINAVCPQIPLGDLFKGIVPFLLMDVVTTAILYAFPIISHRFCDGML